MDHTTKIQNNIPVAYPKKTTSSSHIIKRTKYKLPKWNTSFWNIFKSITFHLQTPMPMPVQETHQGCCMQHCPSTGILQGQIRLHLFQEIGAEEVIPSLKLENRLSQKEI